MWLILANLTSRWYNVQWWLWRRKISRQAIFWLMHLCDRLTRHDLASWHATRNGGYSIWDLSHSFGDVSCRCRIFKICSWLLMCPWKYRKGGLKNPIQSLLDKIRTLSTLSTYSSLCYWIFLCLNHKTKDWKMFGVVKKLLPISSVCVNFLFTSCSNRSVNTIETNILHSKIL